MASSGGGAKEEILKVMDPDLLQDVPLLECGIKRMRSSFSFFTPQFLIIGDSGTGKSCLLRYFLERKCTLSRACRAYVHSLCCDAYPNE